MVSDDDVRKRKKLVLLGLLLLLFLLTASTLPLMNVGVGDIVASPVALAHTASPPVQSPTVTPVVTMLPADFRATAVIATEIPSSPTLTVDDGNQATASNEWVEVSPEKEIEVAEGDDSKPVVEPSREAEAGPIMAEETPVTAVAIQTSTPVILTPTASTIPTDRPTAKATSLVPVQAQKTPDPNNNQADPAETDVGAPPSNQETAGEQPNSSTANTPEANDAEEGAGSDDQTTEEGRTTPEAADDFQLEAAPDPNIAEHMRGEESLPAQTDAQDTTPIQNASDSSIDSPEVTAGERQSQSKNPDDTPAASESEIAPDNLPITGIQVVNVHWITIGVAFGFILLLVIFGLAAVDNSNRLP